MQSIQRPACPRGANPGKKRTCPCGQTFIPHLCRPLCPARSQGSTEIKKDRPGIAARARKQTMNPRFNRIRPALWQITSRKDQTPQEYPPQHKPQKHPRRASHYGTNPHSPPTQPKCPSYPVYPHSKRPQLRKSHQNARKHPLKRKHQKAPETGAPCLLFTHRTPPKGHPVPTAPFPSSGQNRPLGQIERPVQHENHAGICLNLSPAVSDRVTDRLTPSPLAARKSRFRKAEGKPENQLAERHTAQRQNTDASAHNSAQGRL